MDWFSLKFQIAKISSQLILQEGKTAIVSGPSAKIRGPLILTRLCPALYLPTVC
jgi:hypothetical protein